ncbi:MAG: AraC family transcriptional regulator, partial [Tannerellaceae bacterium]|nr:AraC family transcriptional regulator [Tannerellaceae bacterium]
ILRLEFVYNINCVMKLLYIEEHLACKNYVSDFNIGFNHIHAKAGDTLDLDDKDSNFLLFVLEGEMVFSSNVYNNLQVPGGQVLFAAQDTKLHGECITDSNYLILSFDNQFTLCDQLALEALLPFIEEPSYTLDIRPPMQMVIDSVTFFLSHKIQCRHLHSIKQKEIFLIFRTFYTKQEMACFLSPILNRDLDFKAFILKHYQEVKTVEELAELCHVSVRSFNRKFNEYFDDSPYSWILKQKSKHVKTRLADGKTPFADIIKEFGFSSPAHFTTYCKKQFGSNPSKLRRQLVAENHAEALGGK